MAKVQEDLASGSYSSGAILYLRDAVATGSNTSFAGLFLGSSPGTDYVIGKQSTNLVGTLAIKTGAGSTLLTLDASGNQELTGSIKTAAPSGGTAKPWKLGEAGVSVGGATTQTLWGGIEFGSNKFKQFPAYSGRQGRGSRGWFIYPTLRRIQPELINKWEESFNRIIKEWI